jgi:hypothetical protein
MRALGWQRWTTVVLLGVFGLAGGGCGDFIPPDPASEDLESVRAVTTKYQDVNVALRDGYVREGPCTSSPAGLMGVHYTNFPRVDSVIKLLEPEQLLYIEENGRWRLIGVEYLMPAYEQDGKPVFGDTPPKNPIAAPILFGQRFNGPMPGHAPNQPWHYDLHIWMYANNPSGLFAQWNPTLQCTP